MPVRIGEETLALYGGRAAFVARVEAFRDEIEVHRFTEHVPAPIEDELVAQVARSGVPVDEIEEVVAPSIAAARQETEDLRARLAQLEALVAKLTGGAP